MKRTKQEKTEKPEKIEKREIKKETASVSVEQIFAHAVALNQSGRLKNIIYGIGNKIYIKNSDNTVLIRFISPDGGFHNSISFKANDYEGNSFFERDGKIVFETTDEGYEKTKSCSVPGQTAEEVQELFKTFKPIKENRINIHSNILSLLDRALSHVEISAVNGEFKLVQRNIYSGSLSEISKKSKGLMISTDEISGDFGPVGLRTQDFESLFTFQSSLDFFFDPEHGFVRVKGSRWKMIAIIATCLYDEIGEIAFLKE